MLAAAPNAIGGPVSILKSGDTIVKAFIEAGLWALISISILLWLALRRITDVLLTLVPLLVAGAVTLEICVLIGLPLNFANIVALGAWKWRDLLAKKSFCYLFQPWYLYG